MNAELILDARCKVGESVIWHATEHTLYWVDILAKQLHRYELSTAWHCVWDTPEMLGCIALHQAGGLIAAAETGIFKIDFIYNNKYNINTINNINNNYIKNNYINNNVKIKPDLQWCLLASVTHNNLMINNNPAMRFNDGRCDRQGRFITGTMTCQQLIGQGNPTLYQYSHAQLQTLLPLNDWVRPFTTPNGMAFSPDGRTYYLSDSHASQQRIWAFDYDTATGNISRGREWVDMNQYAGRPDGAAIDTDGCYWICATDAGMVHRFTPAGCLDYSLKLPIKKPSICTWGGTDLRTLYVSSIRPHGLGADMSEQPLAGGIFAFTNLSAQGLLETPCRG